MSSWNDAAVQNHNGAGFNHLNDPNAGLDPSSFMTNPPSFDPSQFPNPQLQQRMQNGGMRNGSPVFNNPIYQTNPVIPSKRSRPREDSLGTSPHQAPGMLPNSRSQTPQQTPYPGFQSNNVPQQHATQQIPYSHLQNGSSNASPSPIMTNQLRPGVPQRVSTASPHPFSPAGQQFSSHASPSQSEHGSRTDTPQNNPYVPNSGFAQGFNQNFTPPPGRTSAPPQGGMPTPMQQQPHMQPQIYAQQNQPGQPPRPQTVEQQKALYQMRLAQQMQQGSILAQQRQNMSQGQIPKQQMPGQNGQYAGMRPQQPPASRSANADTFLKSLTQFMQSKQQPLETNPIVEGRQISIVMLYMAVAKFGGFRKVTQQNGWPSVAQTLQFHPMQNPGAAQQLKIHYERYLLMFEDAWQTNVQRQRAQQGAMAGPGPQMSPNKQLNAQVAMPQAQQFMQQQLSLQQQHTQVTPMKQMTSMHHASQPSINGFSTPQAPQAQSLSMGPQSHSRNSLPRNMEATPQQNGPSFTMPSPLSATKPSSLSLPSPQVDNTPLSQDYDLSPELDPKVRHLDTFGGIELDSLLKLGNDIIKYRPDVPAVGDLGAIDIHALTMSLQSGLKAEVRLALDTLLLLSFEQRVQLDLRACEDLAESLIDCAEMQLDLLAENAAEVSDMMLVTSYEDILRGCNSEKEILQDIPVFGSTDYELDRAVDRLICITTIMRNLSFHELNHHSLAEKFVIKFLCIVIRYLGTRNMLLRTNQNTLDFMKDIIILLSNISQAVELPGREQALCLLHFLLAFAPSPPPHTSDGMSFTPYDPAVHRYLPTAVDSLAKLLARDEPNRIYYKTIFSSDTSSTPPFDLLTRTFALAISPIPEQKLDSQRGNLVHVIEARKAYLMQGVLAAEILSNMAPGYETGLAKSWLTSEDGFSQNLSRLIIWLCIETPSQVPQHRSQVVPRGVEDDALLHITFGGLAVLRRLAEKSRDPENPNSAIPIAGIPARESLLAALKVTQPRLKDVLKQLCAYAGMGT
ncbi:hypothetical protein B7494_g4041 [Chlorociboria aeruginascens]|nr:hypothetical protein B7494_g4041 [Chlorociboria aeruginascens]